MVRPQPLPAPERVRVESPATRAETRRRAQAPVRRGRQDALTELPWARVRHAPPFPACAHAAAILRAFRLAEARVPKNSQPEGARAALRAGPVRATFQPVDPALRA